VRYVTYLFFNEDLIFWHILIISRFSIDKFCNSTLWAYSNA